MESFNSQDFADYFNEFRYIDDDGKSEDDSVEDDGNKTEDADAEWLKKVGINPNDFIAQDGNEDERNEVLEDFCKSLTLKQASIVRKKFTSVKATIRKKKRAHKIRDVREVFSSQNVLSGETTSNATRSRSATPDSLDYLSSPSPHEWISEAINVSPTFSQGYHSNGRTSPNGSSSIVSTTTAPTSSLHWKLPSTQHLRRRSESGGDKEATTVGSQESLSEVTSSTYCNEQRSQSQFYVNSIETPFTREQLQKRDPVAGSDDLESGVAILGFQNRSSIHRNRSLNVTTSTSQSEDVSLDDVGIDIESDQEWGFESCNIDLDDDKFDSFHSLLLDKRGGVTCINDLSLDDVQQIQALILLELAYILDQYKLQYSRRKPVKVKRREVVAIFGNPLTSLIENDQKLVPHCRIPLVLEKILYHLERFGLKEEGILRVPGSMHKVQLIKQEMEMKFYVSPSSIDHILQSCSINDVTALLKQFLRELPVPLLTNEYIDAFFLLEKIPDKLDQLKALKALILLIPEVHRNTLWALLCFLSKVVSNERYNRMGLQNVAMIIAPNLFVPKKFKGDNKKDLASEMKLASSTCSLTKLMIRYHNILFNVPRFLIQQIRAKNDSLVKRRNLKENNRPKLWLLTRKPRLEIYRRINNEVDYQNGVIRVQAPQLNRTDIPVHLTASMTAGDVVVEVLCDNRRLVDVGEEVHRDRRRPVVRQDSRRALSELAPNSSLSCLVASASSESAIRTHVLCEVGGNIGKRRLHHNTAVAFVYQSNPNAEWLIECRHHGSPTQKHKMSFYDLIA